jgi:hypothetical protein
MKILAYLKREEVWGLGFWGEPLPWSCLRE